MTTKGFAGRPKYVSANDEGLPEKTDRYEMRRGLACVGPSGARPGCQGRTPFGPTRRIPKSADPSIVILPSDHGITEDLGEVFRPKRARRELGDAVLRERALDERRDI